MKIGMRIEARGDSKKKILLLALCSMFPAPCFPAEAQQPTNVPRIGLLIPSSQSAYSARIDAFRMGLREFGYIEGQNVVIEYRYSEGQTNRLSDLAADLVRHKVAVIVSGTRPAIFAAQRASSTTPIVFAGVGRDPVADGLVSSLANQAETSPG